MPIILDGTIGVTFPAGSQTAPSITTTGDTNTGIYFPAADTIAFSEGGTEAMRISSTGGLSIGTTADSGAGSIYATGNITAFYTSDIKFKTNIKPIQNALDKVLAIGGKEFDWTEEYIASLGGEDGYFVRKKDFGVIAQDVQQAFPLATRTKSDGTLAVDYEKMCALAFAAITELNSKIKELETKL